MSNKGDSGNGTQENPGCSLTKAVEDVSLHGLAQIEALKKKQKIFNAIQKNLSAIEMKGCMKEEELSSKKKELLKLECEMEYLHRQRKAFHGDCASVSKEITKLQISITEEQENARTALAGFIAYRDKMKGHREAVLHAASQTEAHREVEEKRELVRTLMEKKEELKEDLENPNGNAVQMAKREIDALTREISVKKKATAEWRERLQKEFEIQTQLKKKIKIQNRRHEAIVKRLKCQLSRAQATHRQMSGDIYCLERQIIELKNQLKASQELAVSGQ